MSVNCRILLSGDVRLQDVATVMGLLAGLPAESRSLENRGGTYSYVRVSGVGVSGTYSPEMAQILLKGPMVDGDTQHSVYYHFEPSGGVGRALMPVSTAFWIAIGKGLVDFFGGTVDYADCDDVRVNYERPPQGSNCPEDGRVWQAFEDRIKAVQPLTKKDLARNVKNSGYYQP